MDKNFLIIANWKSNDVELKKWFDKFTSGPFEIAIAPSFPHISNIPNGFSRCAQDVSAFPSGAFTGEVSAQMLKAMRVKYCLIGHSERRKYLHETNDDINLKFEALINEDIIPIICAQSFDEIPVEILRQAQGDVCVMYEPFEAISTDGQYNPESPEIIAQTLVDWQVKLPPETRFLYGGSVNPENCKLIIENCKLVSGFVVGHASLDPIIFSSVVNSILAT